MGPTWIGALPVNRDEQKQESHSVDTPVGTSFAALGIESSGTVGWLIALLLAVQLTFMGSAPAENAQFRRRSNLLDEFIALWSSQTVERTR